MVPQHLAPGIKPVARRTGVETFWEKLVRDARARALKLLPLPATINAADEDTQCAVHHPLARPVTRDQDEKTKQDEATSEADIMPYTGQTFQPPSMSSSPAEDPSPDAKPPCCVRHGPPRQASSPKSSRHTRAPDDSSNPSHPDDDYHLTAREISQWCLQQRNLAQGNCQQIVESKEENEARVLFQDAERKAQEERARFKNGGRRIDAAEKRVSHHRMLHTRRAGLTATLLPTLHAPLISHLPCYAPTLWPSSTRKQRLQIHYE
jgi:hypothetical protein